MELEQPTLGERIHSVRKYLGLSQEEFGERIQVSRRALQNYETGERQPPTEVVKSIFLKFSVDPTWLLDGDTLKPRFMDPDADDKLLEDILKEVDNYITRNSVQISQEKKVRIIRMLFNEFKDTYTLDGKRVIDLIKLAS